MAPKRSDLQRLDTAAQRPPSVDVLARSLADLDLPHAILVDIARRAIASGNADAARGIAQTFRSSMLQPVINATGVLLHTNLARAPIDVEHNAGAKRVGRPWQLVLLDHGTYVGRPHH